MFIKNFGFKFENLAKKDRFKSSVEKLRIGSAIWDIGKGEEITLVFSRDGSFMVMGYCSHMQKIAQYYPMKQGPIKQWDFKTSFFFPEDWKGHWPKHAVESIVSKMRERIG